MKKLSDVGRRCPQQVPAHCKADCLWQAFKHGLLILPLTTPNEYLGSTTCTRGARAVRLKGQTTLRSKTYSCISGDICCSPADLAGVQVLHCTQQLHHVAGHRLPWQACGVAVQVLQQSALHKLKHQVLHHIIQLSGNSPASHITKLSGQANPALASSWALSISASRDAKPGTPRSRPKGPGPCQQHDEATTCTGAQQRRQGFPLQLMVQMTAACKAGGSPACPCAERPPAGSQGARA